MSRSFRYSSMTLLLAGSVATGTWHSAMAQDASLVLEEITITASRRVETAQKAAISVDAISAEELADVGTNPGDLSRLSPSVQINQISNVYPQSTVRGVGNNTVNPYTDSTVGFNYDGVPISRVASSVGLYYDLQRVEVLKGPQGTLYGRNTTGGAINIIPRAPELGKTSGNLTLEGGSYSLKRGSGAINLPLGETAALRAAFNIIDRDGYYHSGLADDVGQSGRVTFRTEPNDDLTLQLGVDYHHQGGKGGGTTLLNSSFVAPIPGVGPVPGYRLYTTDGKPLGGDPWVDVNQLNQRCDGVDRSANSTGSLDWDDWFYTPTANDPNSVCRSDGKRDDTFYGVTGLADIGLGGGTLTIIPSWRVSELKSQTIGQPNIRNDEDSDTYTLEARYVSSADGPFSYIVGAFYLDEKVDARYQPQISYPNNRPTFQSIKSTTSSYAAFATAKYAFTDFLRGSLGARYTKDDKTFDGTTRPFGTPSLSVAIKDSWDEVTYNAGLEMDVAQESLVYLNYARGYKAGGFFFATPLAGYVPASGTNKPGIVTGNTFDPEYVDAITLGSKNYFMGKRLLLNAEIFNYKYTDQQVGQFLNDDWDNPPDGIYSNNTFGTVNLGEVEIFGVELETQFLATENTLLSLNLQYLDTEVSGTAQTATSQLLGAPANNKGYPVANAPEFTANAGIQQTFPIGSAKLVADLRGQYRGDVILGGYAPFGKADPVTTGDFSLRFDSGSMWSVTAYVNNFTDEVVPVIIQGTGEARGGAGPGAPPPVGVYTASYRAPRTYGVRLALQF